MLIRLSRFILEALPFILSAVIGIFIASGSIHSRIRDPQVAPLSSSDRPDGVAGKRVEADPARSRYAAAHAGAAEASDYR